MSNTPSRREFLQVVAGAAAPGAIAVAKAAVNDWRALFDGKTTAG